MVCDLCNKTYNSVLCSSRWKTLRIKKKKKIVSYSQKLYTYNIIYIFILLNHSKSSLDSRGMRNDNFNFENSIINKKDLPRLRFEIIVIFSFDPNKLPIK